MQGRKAKAASYQRCGRTVRYFSSAEDDAAERLRIDGNSLGAIARALGRGKSAVQLRLIALAKRAEGGP